MKKVRRYASFTYPSIYKRYIEKDTKEGGHMPDKGGYITKEYIISGKLYENDSPPEIVNDVESIRWSSFDPTIIYSKSIGYWPTEIKDHITQYESIYLCEHILDNGDKCNKAASTILEGRWYCDDHSSIP